MRSPFWEFGSMPGALKSAESSSLMGSTQGRRWAWALGRAISQLPRPHITIRHFSFKTVTCGRSRVGEVKGGKRGHT